MPLLPPAAALPLAPDALSLAAGVLLAPDAALPEDDLSADELPLAAGALELGVLALPDALPPAEPEEPVSDFGWLIDGLLCDCSFCLSWATAPNDSMAAATATAMGLNLMRSPFAGIPIGTTRH
jgi:hypothetical protein